MWPGAVAGPVMFLGTLAILLAPVSSLAAWTLNCASALCTGYLIVVAHFLPHFQGRSTIADHPEVVAIVLFYGMLAGVVALSRSIGLRRAEGTAEPPPRLHAGEGAAAGGVHRLRLLRRRAPPVCLPPVTRYRSWMSGKGTRR